MNKYKIEILKIEKNMNKPKHLRQYGVYITFMRKRDGLKYNGYSSYLAEDERQAYYMAWQEYTELVKKSWKITDVKVVEHI